MKRYTIFCVLLLAPFLLFSQTSHVVSVPWLMGFESTGSDSTELSDEWVLNAGAQSSACNDQWTVGNAISSGGKSSLYITGDTTLLPGFGTAANLQFAYRDIQLPAGSYTLSFDWLNGGDENAVLYVGYVSYSNPSQGSVTYITANSSSGVLPTALANTNCTEALYGQESWQSYTFARNISVSGNNTSIYRLYVAWANNGKSVKAGSAFGACVDNIQIADARAPRPSDIAVEAVSCDTLRLTWNGVADTYIVEYSMSGTNVWLTVPYDPSVPNSAMLEGLEEGEYRIRVCGVSYDSENNAIRSAYVYAEDYLVYCVDRHCLAYFDLDGDNVVCTTGDFSKGNLQAAFYEEGPAVDYGSTSKMSRHTVNWDRTATDERTGGALKCVPSGALASVRLGNWVNGAQCEGITYSFVVDSAYSLLLLRYALVLEDPEHDTDQQPRFTLEILDEYGFEIDATCGYVNFAADASREGWHAIPGVTSYVTWKDWTTTGLDLTEYAGQTIKVRLATYDCSETGHYGYAYFTLDCASATIQTASCGEETTLSAPDGFNYEWLDPEGKLLGESSTLHLTHATAGEYTCRLINKEVPDCAVSRSISVYPKYPVAMGNWSPDFKDCQNIVRFTSKSYVYAMRDSIGSEDPNERLGGIRWDFGDGESSEEAECVHTFPSEGGTYIVTLAAWLGDGTGDCYSEDTLRVVLYPMVPDTTIESDVSICEGEVLDFHGESLSTAGTHVVDSISPMGCSVHLVCNLTVNPRYEIALPDTILCDYDTLWIGDAYYAPRVDGTFRVSLANQYGCDSVIVVNVSYADPVAPTMDVVQMSDVADEATIRFGGSGYTYYIVNGDESHPQTSSVITTSEPADYVFDFYNEYGCTARLTTTIVASCLRDMIFQRWNDVIALKNEAYNGGMRFLGYQWYKDDVLIEGATASYYYAPEGLETGANYSCSVLREDSTWSMTCVYEAIDQAGVLRGVSVAPTTVVSGGEVLVSVPESCTLHCYDAMGVCLFSAALEEGQNRLSVPLSAGTYILSVRLAEGAVPVRLQVR